MITILMATYNGEEHIKAQLASIFDQTLRDFRLIVQDDGSTDQTLSIVQAYEKKYQKQIECMRNEFPAGSAKGNFFLMLNRLKQERQAGSALGDREYFIFADQDDVWKPDKLEKLQHRMQAMEKKYGSATPLLVYSDLEVVDVHLQTIHKSMQRMMKHRTGAKRLQELLVENDVTGNSLMFNRALLDVYAPPKDSPMHDWYLALLAKVYGKTGFLDEPLTLYRQHDKNSLGVKRLGFFRAVMGKIMRTKDEKAKIQKTYREMFAQAESILWGLEKADHVLHGFEAEESDETDLRNTRQIHAACQILREFVSLQKRSRVGKIVCIFRNRFFKSRMLMTLGQLFSI